MRVTFLSALVLSACSLSMSAATIAFTGTGQFSNITNCGSGTPTCSITSSGGTNNVLNMSGYSATYPYSPSTLTAVKTTNSFNMTAPMSGVTLGEIDWTNRATYQTDTNFNATYTFNLSFSAPNASSDSQAFSLNLLQTTNPTGDQVLSLSNSTLAGLGPFTLNGMTMSNLRFALATGTSGSYSNGSWLNPEGATSRVLIQADFAPAATPEPSSIALLGTGLVGVAGAIRRRLKA